MDKYSIVKLITLPDLSDEPGNERDAEWSEYESYRKCSKCGYQHYIYYFGEEKKSGSINQVLCSNCGAQLSNKDLGYEFGFSNPKGRIWEFVDWYNAQDFPGEVKKTLRMPREDIEMVIDGLRTLDDWDESFRKYIDPGRGSYERPYHKAWLLVSTKERRKQYPPEPENYVDENVFPFLRYLRKNITDRKQEEVQQLIETTELECSKAIPRSAGLQTKMDTAQLREYLEKLINLETSIYSLTKRLEVLYFDEPELAKTCKADLTGQIKEQRVKQKQLHAYYEKLSGEKPVVDPASLIPPLKREDMTSKYPPLPAEPQPPVLEEPKFFNKKKVEESNQAKTAAYEKAHQEWEAAIAERERMIEALEQQATDEYNQKREALIREYAPIIQQEQQKQDQEHAEKLAKVKAAYEQTFDEIGKLTAESENMNLPLTLEKAEAEQMLKDLIEAKIKLLSYNIIFPKYRNIVAYTTMYEYFLTGRCETLEGPAGAYNLYESEIRADMVIAQLSTVIASLEQIKDNQYMLYTELQSVNAGLNNLNRTAAKMSQTMTTMNENIDRIADNSDVIAYNTAKTAYYSEKTAKLTDALGYMVALK